MGLVYLQKNLSCLIFGSKRISLPHQLILPLLFIEVVRLFPWEYFQILLLSSSYHLWVFLLKLLRNINPLTPVHQDEKKLPNTNSVDYRELHQAPLSFLQPRVDNLNVHVCLSYRFRGRPAPKCLLK
jgi:hypothetical protein